MKTILKFLYIFILLYIGFNVYNDALAERNKTFFENEALVKLEQNNNEEFISTTMYMLGADLYIKEPIYSFSSNDENYKFDFEIYYYVRYEGKKISLNLAFYILNVDFKDEYKNMDITFYSDSSNNFIQSKYELKYKDKAINGNLISNLVLDGNFKADSKNLSIIKQIELRLNGKVIAIINHNDDFEMEDSNLAEFNLVEGSIVTNEFNGKFDNYDRYKTVINDLNNVSNVDKKLIKKYNSVVTKRVISYSVVAIIGGVLVFFLEPIINFIKSIKKKDKNKTKPEVKNS